MLGSLEIQQNPYTRISTAHAGLCTTYRQHLRPEIWKSNNWIKFKDLFPLKKCERFKLTIRRDTLLILFWRTQRLVTSRTLSFHFLYEKINIQNNVCVSANMKYTPLIHQTYELWSKSCKFICLPNVRHKGQHPKTKQLTWNWQLEINQGVNWKNLTWICPAFSFTILVFVLWSQSESCRGRWAAVSGTPYTLAKDLLMQ